MPRRWSWHFSTGAVCYIYDGELHEKRFVLDGSNLFVSDFPFILLAFYSKLTICPLMLCLFLFQQEVNFVSATGDTVMIKTDITIKRAPFFLYMLSQLCKLVFSACKRLKDYIRVRVIWEYQVKNKKAENTEGWSKPKDNGHNVQSYWIESTEEQIIRSYPGVQLSNIKSQLRPTCWLWQLWLYMPLRNHQTFILIRGISGPRLTFAPLKSTFDTKRQWNIRSNQTLIHVFLLFTNLAGQSEAKWVTATTVYYKRRQSPTNPQPTLLSYTF